MSQVRFNICSQAQYDALESSSGYDSGSFYYVVTNPSSPNSGDSAKLYIGTHEVGAGMTIEDVLEYFYSNELTFPLLTAGDITPKSDAPIEMSSFFDIQTTGGDNDLRTGAGNLRRVRGNLYDYETETTSSGGVTSGLSPFTAASYNSTQMNLISVTSVITSSTINTSTNKIASGSNNLYFFPVDRGEWGSYGTTQGNNGYIAVGFPSGHLVRVAFCETMPASDSEITVMTGDPYVHTESAEHGGHSYYLPQEKGWLVLEVSATLTTDASGNVLDGTTPVGCHIAWSNYNDEDPGTYGISIINLTPALPTGTNDHTWGLAGIVSPAKSVFDEIDLVDQVSYMRIGRKTLASLSWTGGEISGDPGEQTRVYNANISDMSTDGLWATDASEYNLTMTENTVSVSVSYTEGDTGPIFKGEYIYYELEAPVETSISISSGIQANDFGLTYFMTSEGELTVPVKAWVDESFQQSGKDQIFNNITYVKTMAEVVATALCELDDRLKPIEEGLENGFQYLKVEDLLVNNLTITGEFSLFSWDDFDFS